MLFQDNSRVFSGLEVMSDASLQDTKHAVVVGQSWLEILLPLYGKETL
jgi:hypothetical protein